MGRRARHRARQRTHPRRAAVSDPGIWDHIKNSGEFDAESLDLEWIGNVPGKREYRRLVGDYTLHQRDVIEQTRFDDGVAFGGWSIDLHPKEGMYASGAGAVQRFSNGVFEIPFRSLYSADVDNLLLAGRDVSATHIAFGAARVMATCAAMGEAAGTAAALTIAHGTTPRGLYEHHRDDLRQVLLRQDAPLIGVADADPRNLATTARVSASGVRAGLGPLETASVRPHALVHDLGIVVPVHPRLDGFELRVAAEHDVDLEIEVFSTGLPQNVVPERLEHAVTVPVTAGAARWIHAPVRWEPETPANAVVVVRAQPGVSVFVTEELPPGILTLVHTSDADDQNVQVSLDELLVQWPTKPLRGRSVQFRVPSPSEALAPERAVGGYHRPFGGPNLWASAPLREGEAWLRLDWDEPVSASEVVLGVRRRPRCGAQHAPPPPGSAPRDALPRRGLPGRGAGDRVGRLGRGGAGGAEPTPAAAAPAARRRGAGPRGARGRDGHQRRTGGADRGLPRSGVTCRAIP